MRFHQLGRSGLRVSEFALGAMTFGMKDWGCDEQTARGLIDRFLDAGGNLLDTADGYPGSEEICGRALVGRRGRVILATKVGMPVGRGPHDRGASRLHIRRACEASLRRLGTEYIDLYQLHVDDEATPIEETLAALDDLVTAGKVLYVGASNMRAYRLMKALAISDRVGLCRFISFQGQYNLIVRSLEREHFRLFAEEGVGCISWSPLAAGMLTGKLQRDSSGSTRLAQREVAFDSLVKNERGFSIIEVVRKLAADVGCTPAQIALAWQRSKPVASVLLGARTMAQLEDNLAASELELPAETFEQLDRATTPPDEYPGMFIDVFQSWLRGDGTPVRGR